ncbi:MAG: hydantoinase/oxoprolinase N-terminal domain-containing protein [Acidimicrobiales bacterium]
MPILLGVDTGGTFTDAVVVAEESSRVLGRAKAPTTHDDLAVGIGSAIDAALDASSHRAEEIDLVSLSTTLATNALVEDKGRRACLVLVGFGPEALSRAGLGHALEQNELVIVEGGHTSHGEEAQPLNLVEVEEAVVQAAARVEAFAVAAQFSVRNPAHEIAIRDLVIERTGLPTTCSHELSAALNGPKRALTALLNARLVALVNELLLAAENMLAERGFDAPIMVVRGDGTLVSSEFVRTRPIETVLSGPAASLIGATQLTSQPNVCIADMGGTTTDIAILRDRKPELSPSGAVVGGHTTMVKAVRMHTFGLGGDSEVAVKADAVGAELRLGPRRVTPLARLAMGHGDAVKTSLARQLKDPIGREFDGVFLARSSRQAPAGSLSHSESALLNMVGDQPIPADQVLESRRTVRTLDQLVRQGLLSLASFTPTDAAHVLGHQGDLDTGVAELAAELFAQRRDRFGDRIASDAADLSQHVFAQVVRMSAEYLLAATMSADGLPFGSEQSPLAQRALDGAIGSTRLDVGLSVPAVGLGAPAATYYPAVAKLLRTESVVPGDAAVANAIGATAGRVAVSAEVVVSAPRRGVFRVHDQHDPLTLYDLDEARAAAEAAATDQAIKAAVRAGAREVSSNVTWTEKSAMVEDRPYFVEAIAEATATGRPRLR